MRGNEHLEFQYQLKEGTKTSYYLESGIENILPKRICITRGEFAATSGRIKEKSGQIKATFTKSESSPYKIGKGSIHSTIYKPLKNECRILGTGDIQGTNDLLIFESIDSWHKIKIHLFPGGLFNEVELLKAVMKNPLP